MEAPYLMAEPQNTGVVLIFNKFGDSDVEHYRIYGDTASGPSLLLAETDKTHLYLTGLENSNAWYFTVTGVDSADTRSDLPGDGNTMVSPEPARTSSLSPEHGPTIEAAHRASGARRLQPQGATRSADGRRCPRRCSW